jgi:hypothetical protein
MPQNGAALWIVWKRSRSFEIDRSERSRLTIFRLAKPSVGYPIGWIHLFAEDAC